MSPVKSRREQYSEATRTALLDAATRRFAEDGFAGTSLEDVATDIQATRGAVYHHFDGKMALFQAVFERLEEQNITRVVEAAATAADPWERAWTGLEAFLDGAADPLYGRLIWQEAPLALGWQRWKECEERYAYAVIEDMIRSLVEAGELPELPMEPTTRIVFHVLGAAGLALSEAAPEDKERVRAEYGHVIREMLGGVRLT